MVRVNRIGEMILFTINKVESIILNKKKIFQSAIKKSQLLFYKEVPFIYLDTLIKKVKSVWVDMGKYVDLVFVEQQSIIYETKMKLNKNSV